MLAKISALYNFEDLADYSGYGTYLTGTYGAFSGVRINFWVNF
jgi:hypothetical protein